MRDYACQGQQSAAAREKSAGCIPAGSLGNLAVSDASEDIAAPCFLLPIARQGFLQATTLERPSFVWRVQRPWRSSSFTAKRLDRRGCFFHGYFIPRLTTSATPPMPLLRHLHIPGLVRYQYVASIQQNLVTQFLQWKADPSTSAPAPTIITTEFLPVYTCGRREVGTLTAAQIEHLRTDGRADFVEALRGGQTTFHGPGQLVAYPIIDLRTHGLTPRSYVCLLEAILIRTCGRYGIHAMRTEHTGVWTSQDDKIAAVGIHLRRNVTSHGIGLNVKTDLWWFDRIVACGLEGKNTTTFEKEGVTGQSVEEVGDVFVEEFANKLGIDNVSKTSTLPTSRGFPVAP